MNRMLKPLNTSDKTKPAKTSIIITCHNYGRFLNWAIQSALQQSQPAKEIIVINDSSSDDTNLIAKKHESDIRYFYVDYSCAQKTRNFGLSQATGEYILFLDADDFLDNYSLEHFEPELDNDASLKLVYSGWYIFGNIVTISNLKLPFIKIPENFNLNRLQQKNYIAITSLFRKSEFPGFDPKIKRLQDWEAWLSYLHNNSDAKCLKIPLFHIRFHGQNKTTNNQYYTERFKVLAKHNLLNINIHNKEYIKPSNPSINNTNSTKIIKVFIIASPIKPIENSFFSCLINDPRIDICTISLNTKNINNSDQININFDKKNVNLSFIFGENLDETLRSSLQSNNFRDADWLIFSDLSEKIKFEDLILFKDEKRPLTIVTTKFDWSLGLDLAPFIAFNHESSQKFFDNFTDKINQPTPNLIFKIKYNLSILWGKYIGWRFTSN